MLVNAVMVDECCFRHKKEVEWPLIQKKYVSLQSKINNNCIMSIQLAFVLFILVALVGWGLAEWKGKFAFTHSEAEKKEVSEIEEKKKAEGYKEMNLHDLIQHNSTKGYKAV